MRGVADTAQRQWAPPAATGAHTVTAAEHGTTAQHLGVHPPPPTRKRAPPTLLWLYPCVHWSKQTWRTTAHGRVRATPARRTARMGHGVRMAVHHQLADRHDRAGRHGSKHHPRQPHHTTPGCEHLVGIRALIVCAPAEPGKRHHTRQSQHQEDAARTHTRRHTHRVTARHCMQQLEVDGKPGQPTHMDRHWFTRPTSAIDADAVWPTSMNMSTSATMANTPSKNMHHVTTRAPTGRHVNTLCCTKPSPRSDTHTELSPAAA